MKVVFWILVFLGIVLYTCSWMICDAFYWDNAQYWNLLFNKYGLTANPYIKEWHLLRWKLFALERCVWIGLLSMLLSGNIKYAIVIVLDFAIGTFIDRVFFDILVFSWNDLIIWIFAVIYGWKSFFPNSYEKFLGKYIARLKTQLATLYLLNPWITKKK